MVTIETQCTISCVVDTNVCT